MNQKIKYDIYFTAEEYKQLDTCVWNTQKNRKGLTLENPSKNIHNFIKYISQKEDLKVSFIILKY
jgi:hypothetical protein